MRIGLAAVLFLLSATGQSPRDPLTAAGTIPMPGVDGRIDHLAVDVSGKRLFVAAVDNNSLEVLDVSAMRVAKSVGRLDEPQGIQFLPDRNRVVVANGGNGSVVFYDAQSLAVAHTTK